MEKLSGHIFFSLLTTASIAIVFLACDSKHGAVSLQNDNNKKIKVADLSTDRGVYKVNEDVKLSYTFINEEPTDVTIKNRTVQVKDMSNTSFPVVYEKGIESMLMLNIQEKHDDDSGTYLKDKNDQLELLSIAGITIGLR